MSKLNFGEVQPIPKGDYQPTVPYNFLNIVSLSGRSYICSNRAGAPVGYGLEDSRYWQLLSEKGVINQADFDALVSEVVLKSNQTDLEALVSEVVLKSNQTDLEALVLEMATKTNQTDFEALRTTVEAINSMYVGTVFEFAAETPPDGALVGDGSLALIADFSELFSVIGYAYTPSLVLVPPGYFYLPDYRGYFLRGHNPNGSRKFGSEQGDAIRNITGTFDGTWLQNATGVFGSFTSIGSSSGGNVAGGAVRATFDAATVVPTADENRPVNKTVLICIKY